MCYQCGCGFRPNPDRGENALRAGKSPIGIWVRVEPRAAHSEQPKPGEIKRGKLLRGKGWLPPFGKPPLAGISGGVESALTLQSNDVEHRTQ